MPGISITILILYQELLYPLLEKPVLAVVIQLFVLIFRNKTFTTPLKFLNCSVLLH